MKETLDTIILAREKIESLIEERNAAIARAEEAEAREERWKRLTWHCITGWCNNEPRPRISSAFVGDDLDAVEKLVKLIRNK